MDDDARERAWQWMHKQKASSVVKIEAGRWDLRFFHTSGGGDDDDGGRCLRYFQEEMSIKPRGEIPLESVTEVSAVRLEASRLPANVDPACHNMAIRLKWKGAKRSFGTNKGDLFLLCGVSNPKETSLRRGEMRAERFGRRREEEWGGGVGRREGRVGEGRGR